MYSVVSLPGGSVAFTDSNNFPWQINYYNPLRALRL